MSGQICLKTNQQQAKENVYRNLKSMIIKESDGGVCAGFHKQI